MARFRLFGRPATAVAAETPAAPPVFAQLPGAWGSARLSTADAGPATTAARPISWLTGDPAPTQPAAFAPIPPPRATGTPSGGMRPVAAPVQQVPVRAAAPPAFVPTPVSSPDPADASALAGAYAADYLSWDEDDPDRRGRVLAEYLAHPGSDPARLGWSGMGRQRAEFALPGKVSPDGDGRVLVDVRVRVTPYRVVGEHGGDTAGDATTGTNGVPASAPAPTARGWRSLASHWVRLSVPVHQENGRLVVDTSEETLGEDPPAGSPPRTGGPEETQLIGLGPIEHSLVDDDLPLVEPWVGGGW